MTALEKAFEYHGEQLDIIKKYFDSINAVPLAINKSGSMMRDYDYTNIWIVCVVDEQVLAYKSHCYLHLGTLGCKKFPEDSVDCGNIKKPRLSELTREKMRGQYRSSALYSGFSKKWTLMSGDECSLGDALNLHKGVIKSIAGTPNLEVTPTQQGLKKNGYYVTTLKGGLLIAVHDNNLYVSRENVFEKLNINNSNDILETGNDQLIGLHLFTENRTHFTFEQAMRIRKKKKAKCIDCGDTVELGESCYFCNRRNRYTPYRYSLLSLS
jgi:hypothetical protein